MLTSEAMTPLRLQVGPDHTLQQVAQKMIQHKVGSAVVFDESLPGPGIITERNILFAAAEHPSLADCHVRDFMSHNLVFIEPSTHLHDAAQMMVDHTIRHLVVIDKGEVVGILSMRDIVHAWVDRDTDDIDPSIEAMMMS